MDTQNFCKTCHRQATGCCLIHETDPFVFGLTIGEIRRISIETKLKPEAFVEKDTVSDKRFNDAVELHPLFSQTLFHRQRFKLKVNGVKCFFLDENGCRLSVNNRPHYCRLYPFWFKSYFIRETRPLKQAVFLHADELHDPAIQIDLHPVLLRSGTCLAQKNVVSHNRILSRLGVTVESLKNIFLDLLKDAYLHQQYMKTDMILPGD